ncbi:hypothetical protein LshimejAT787_1502210 [Lyophyllum shimeji]|uniref:Uncharacterized protein n=1 Tax=Lyophyllum shimeji TaxID=47721 RepID=A0A9P3UTB8_LYOSH|nr:hypothetical protein LshimejAT787_1502210 [Lyophyllum shimeji]
MIIYMPRQRAGKATNPGTKAPTSVILTLSAVSAWEDGGLRYPKDKDKRNGELSDEELALRELEAGLDEEEEAMKDAEGDDDSEDPDDEDSEEWVDEIDALTAEERKTLHLLLSIT